MTTQHAAATAETLRRARGTRRTYAKEVSIDAEEYRNANAGHAPRGYRSWEFLPTHAARGQDPTGRTLPDAEAETQRQALAIWVRGTYAAARKEAAHIAASQGQRHLTLAP